MNNIDKADQENQAVEYLLSGLIYIPAFVCFVVNIKT